MRILKEGLTVNRKLNFKAPVTGGPPYLVIRGMDDLQNPVFLVLRADEVQTLIEEWGETTRST